MIAIFLLCAINLTGVVYLLVVRGDDKIKQIEHENELAILYSKILQLQVKLEKLSGISNKNK